MAGYERMIVKPARHDSQDEQQWYYYKLDGNNKIDYTSELFTSKSGAIDAATRESHGLPIEVHELPEE